MAGSVTIVDFSAAISAALTASVAAAVKETGDAMVSSMQEKMQAGKSGEQYGAHTSSAPGEAPANWHDTLMDTLKSEMTGSTSARVSGGGPDAPYLAADLEFGSPGGKIASRPLFTPTAEEFKPILIENLTNAVKDVIR